MQSRCLLFGLVIFGATFVSDGALHGEEASTAEVIAAPSLNAALPIGADANGSAGALPSQETACLKPTPNCACPLRPQDQFWVVDTNHLPCVDCQAVSAPNLSVSQFHCVSGCVNSSVPELLASGKDAITVLYVPGNRVAGDEAVRRGWLVYDLLVAASDAQPLRLIVWSWPSDRVRGLARDARIKAERTSTESIYLGWLLSQFDSQEQISLVGFSYGSRVISGALQVSASGYLDGSTLSDFVSVSNRRPARVVLMAPAMHNDWLLPGELHAAALTQVDRMLLFYNPCDTVLRHYHRIDKCDRGHSLGHTGFVGTGSLGDLHHKLRQLDVCCWIGKQHDEQSYFRNSRIVGELRQYLLWGAVGCGGGFVKPGASE